jgi:hypothetical protein
MAKILEYKNAKRRTIRLSTEDIISIVQEYQQVTKGVRYLEDIHDRLENRVFYIPEE